MGLQYLRARWCDVQTGAFLTRDAVEANHPYLYVKGNPVNYTDPTGHCAFEDITCQNDANYLYATYGWLVYGVWNRKDVVTIRDAARSIRWFFQRNGGGDTAGRMRAAFGQVNFLDQGWMEMP